MEVNGKFIDNSERYRKKQVRGLMDDTMGDKTDTMEKEQGQSWEIAG